VVGRKASIFSHVVGVKPCGSTQLVVVGEGRHREIAREERVGISRIDSQTVREEVK
jgi:hypothetical protein